MGMGHGHHGPGGLGGRGGGEIDPQDQIREREALERIVTNASMYAPRPILSLDPYISIPQPNSSAGI